MNPPLMSNPHRVSLTSQSGESVQQAGDALFTVSPTKKQPASGRKSSAKTPQLGSSKKRPTLTDRILRAVKRQEFRTATQLANATKTSPANASSILKRCCDRGKLGRCLTHQLTSHPSLPYIYFVPTPQ